MRVKKNTMPEAQDPYQDLAEPGSDGSDEIIDPELLGCQDGDDFEPSAPVQYAVTANPGLNLREEPSIDAPVLAKLPHGVGVFSTGMSQGPWTEVVTGRLVGWVLQEFLEPLWS